MFATVGVSGRCAVGDQTAKPYHTQTFINTAR